MESFLAKPSHWGFKTSGLMAGAIAVGSAVTLGGFFYWRSNSLSSTISEAPIVVEEIRTVTALGRLEPIGEIVTLSAPTSNQGNRIEELRVQEGDRPRLSESSQISLSRRTDRSIR